MRGCDIYCLLCGNPCHSTYNNLSKSFLESVDWYIKNQNNKSKFFIKNFQPIYKKYIENSNLFLDKINYLIKNG